MAGLSQDKRSKNWLISFRYGAVPFLVSSGTTDESTATILKHRIEETLVDLKFGRIDQPPPNLDKKSLQAYILSRGREIAPVKVEIAKVISLGDACRQYSESRHNLEANTITTEQIHLTHLRRVLGENSAVEQIEWSDIERYIKKRINDKKPVRGETVKKELTTFKLLWDYCRRNQIVTKDCPLHHRWAKNLPKKSTRHKFNTYANITKLVDKGGSPDLWAGLFLDNDELIELLTYIRENARQWFVYPACMVAAYTGARRSELTRILVEDINLEDKPTITIREKKRVRDADESYRVIPLHRNLVELFAGLDHTKKYAFTLDNSTKQLTVDDLTNWLKATVKGSKWEIIKGYHLFRHTWITLLLREKIDKLQIAKWAGHTTTTLIDTTYGHLFPADSAADISRLR